MKARFFLLAAGRLLLKVLCMNIICALPYFAAIFSSAAFSLHKGTGELLSRGAAWAGVYFLVLAFAVFDRVLKSSGGFEGFFSRFSLDLLMYGALCAALYAFQLVSESALAEESFAARLFFGPQLSFVTMTGSLLAGAALHLASALAFFALFTLYAKALYRAESLARRAVAVIGRALRALCRIMLSNVPWMFCCGLILFLRGKTVEEGAMTACAFLGFAPFFALYYPLLRRELKGSAHIAAYKKTVLFEFACYAAVCAASSAPYFIKGVSAAMGRELLPAAFLPQFAFAFLFKSAPAGLAASAALAAGFFLYIYLTAGKKLKKQ